FHRLAAKRERHLDKSLRFAILDRVTLFDVLAHLGKPSLWRCLNAGIVVADTSQRKIDSSPRRHAQPHPCRNRTTCTRKPRFRRVEPKRTHVHAIDVVPTRRIATGAAVPAANPQGLRAPSTA